MSAPAIHITSYLLGRLTTYNITPLDISEAAGHEGEVTANAIGAQTMRGIIDTFGAGYKTTDEDFSPMDCPSDNPVTLQSGTSYTLDEFERWPPRGSTVASVTSIIDRCSQISEYWLLETTYSGQVEQAVVKITGLNQDRKKGKCIQSVSLHTVAVRDADGNWLANPQLFQKVGGDTPNYGTGSLGGGALPSTVSGAPGAFRGG